METVMDNQTERLARQRWWLTLTFTLSWLVWQFFSLEPVQAWPYLRGLPVAAIALGAWAVWVVIFFMLFAFMSRVKRERLAHGALDDELTQANRMRCWKVGYFTMLFALAAAVVVAAFKLIDALALTQMLMMVAVSVPLLFFVWLERDTGG
jgi:hypothetical protein